MGFRFNSLLEDAGIDPRDVAIILHTTTLHPLRQLMPSIVAEHPHLFDAYQSVHSMAVQATLRDRRWAASFVPAPQVGLVFVGLFEKVAMENLPVEDIYSDPRFTELEEVFGAVDVGPRANLARGGKQIRFQFDPVSHLSDMIGRLVINVPAGRRYVRIAANLDPEVAEITRDSLLHLPPPAWDELVVAPGALPGVPLSWRHRLKEWCGIYLIVDESDGQRYVGSAYGEENLWGRWREHVRRDHGVTVELRRRDPRNFRFSILELVAPTMGAGEIVPIENAWKRRLHTVEFGLNVA